MIVPTLGWHSYAAQFHAFNTRYQQFHIDVAMVASRNVDSGQLSNVIHSFGAQSVCTKDLSTTVYRTMTVIFRNDVI